VTRTTTTTTTPTRTVTALERAWERSDRLFSLLRGPGTLLARPIALRQPFLFYVGHLPAFAWNHVWRGALGRATFRPEFDQLFERGIDPPDDDDTADDGAAWPEVGAVVDYRDRVRHELRGVLHEPTAERAVAMALEHELMHHETLLYMLHQLPPGQRHVPEGRAPVAGPRARKARISIPRGRTILGARRDGAFRWDNEEPENPVYVEAFSIDDLPVTNREFREFVEAGGYEDRRLWSEAAWAWVTRREHRLPRFWTCEDGSWGVSTLFGCHSFDEAAEWPASVMHCEAEAFARWAGGRLPTEAELHRASYGTPEGGMRPHPWGDAPPGPRHGNFGWRQWAPAPVGSDPEGTSAFGVRELVGNGWEWTKTPFGPFPGFEPLPRYPGYSADFFDGRHFVMLGASWATDASLVRRSFRNWFQPHYPYVFSKFRCVSPA